MSEPRTKAEAILDIRYQIRLHFLHRRFYNRLRAGVAVVSLIAGSSALFTIMRTYPDLLAIAGAVVAAMGVVGLVFGWPDRAAKHDVWRREMAKLLARTAVLSVEEIDTALADHDGAVDDEIEALRILAMNDNLRSNGLEDAVRPVPMTGRLIRLVAA